jgi:hypothetical protein
MQRLPVSAALLLLIAGVWLSVMRQETSSGGESFDKELREIRRGGERADRVPDKTTPPSDSPRLHGIQNNIPPSVPKQSSGIPITPEFVRKLTAGPERTHFALPDGRTAEGVVELRQTAADGSSVGVSGRLHAPRKGRFHFRVQPAGAATGPVVGAVVLDDEEIAFQVLPGAEAPNVLAAMPVDQVICRNFAMPPEHADEPQEIPSTHPIDIPIPTYQNGIVPLQSRPSALAVIYLDLDGEKGPHQGWGDFDAVAPPGMTPAYVRNIWSRVAEDFAPFNLNVTTDLQVFLSAPETARQRCIITPTNNAYPGAGGVAWTQSFSTSGDIPCWCFYYDNPKYAAEIISHEIGHTLGLCHDGRNSPSDDYYLGHGSNSVGWAPIMGAGYYQNLSQWSQGEYLAANQTQDDLAIIAANGDVGLVNDDAGDTHAAAAILEVFANGTINSQGNISTRADADAFRFTTTGGMVALTISPVAAGPNLDVSASLHDSNGALIISNNPDLGIHATLSTALPAGEYTVHVDGTGRGNPLADGYTDYGSLGQYTITGTVGGAVGPDRFTVAENPPAGSVIGTPPARNDHAGSPLAYQITEDNTDSAFAIDPATGVITVANPAAIDFEALSTAWDTSSDIDLVVTISNSSAPELNESLRVVVTVTDVNEAPTVTVSTPLVALSHTAHGTVLGRLTTTDPDRFDFATVEIVAGDPSGIFELSPAGLLTLNGNLDASVQAIHSLTIRATDRGTPSLNNDLTVNLTVIPTPEGFTPGFAYHTIYENIAGMGVADLTAASAFPSSPNNKVRLSSFATGPQGSSYGSTVRAWLIAPVSGNYRFWIAGDDTTKLFFSEAGDPATMADICGTESSTAPNQWTKYESQQSATYSLTAGQVCYIEARHKQQTGADHLSVAWEITDPPGTTIIPRQVIPGRYLSPHYLNNSPQMFAFDVDLYRNSYAGYQVAMAFASDPNLADTHRWEITAGNEAGAFAIDPDSGEVSVTDTTVLAGLETATVTLTLTVTDNGDAPLSDSGPLTIHLLDPSTTPAAGLIQEFWDDVPGISLGDLQALPRFPSRPDRLVDLNSFEYESTIDENFGARIRAYFIPPATGYHTFSIAFENAGSLLLSNNADPANAIEIASADTSQGSLPVPLSAGQRYFIEARVKHDAGDSQLSVTWSRAGGGGSQVIGDAETKPYDSNVAPAFQVPAYTFSQAPDSSPGTVLGTVNATDSPFEAIRYAIVSGDSLGAFAINPKSGTITVSNPGNLAPGTTYQLQVGAQDSGHGRHFAPRETLVPVTILPYNEPPQFVEDPVNLGSFQANEALSVSLVPYVTDPDDAVVFTLVSGPPWISLSPGGDLSGTPTYQDFGPHLLTVSAADSRGHTAYGIVGLTVAAPADIPASTLSAANAAGHPVLGGIQAGTPADSAASDNLYQAFIEQPFENTSALEYTWNFATTPNRPALLEIEAHHTANTEDDGFQFSVSTDGGATFTDAILISNSSDVGTTRQFAFIAGAGGATIVKVVDTNRSSGNNNLDTLFIDLLTVTLAANCVPATSDAIYQVAAEAPHGVAIGSAAAIDPDPGQTLTYTIPRGNSADLFSITPAGMLKVAGTIPPESGPYFLIVVAIDNGTPALANYATITIEVVPPVNASVTFLDLTPTYDGSPQPVTVTTNPPDLTTIITYDGSPSPPTNAGDYTVTASIVDPLHIGSSSDTLSIGKAPAGVSLTGLSQPYDGFQKSVTVTTSPPGLDHALTYGASTTAPTDVGDYTVTATITDPNYSGTSTQTFSITNLLTIAAGQSFTVPQTTIPYQSLLNDGTLIVSTHSLQISGNATNTGILRLYGDAILEISGTFTNSGIIDTINWNGTLPPGLVNTGTILDRTAVRILSTGTTESQFTLSVPDFAGHLYQLETSNIADPWTPLGPPVPGSGNPMNPPALEFTPGLDGPARFYRVVVTPAP